MKLYKGFTKDMKCRDFQYEEGKTYEEDTARLCDKGFHACEDPTDCLEYYPPGSSQYRIVELEGVTDEKHADTKRVGTKIRIGAKISLMDMIQAHFDYVKENCEKAVAAGDA
ncbi:MAG: hypothetical protein IJS84_04940, partial [Spirochaetales bacterium]|nr:hypothetical protein [Spirochaetales bacterium]